MNSWWFVLGITLLLFGLAIFLPSNSLTGHVVVDKTCGDVGCVELCEISETNITSTCGGGTVCCPTSWETGVCDYRMNCEKIREYSLYQSLETYQDSVRERPSAVQADWSRFFLPLLIVLGIVVYFIMKRNNPQD